MSEGHKGDEREQSFSLDEILAEHKKEQEAMPADMRYAALAAEQAEDKSADSLSTLKTLALLKEEYDKEKKKPRVPFENEKYRDLVEPQPDAPVFEAKADETVEFTVDFGQVFAPSNDYLGDMTEEEKPEEKPERKKRSRERAPEPELSPDQAAARIIPELGSLSLRMWPASVLTLLLMYITFSHRWNLPVPSIWVYVKTPYIYLFTLLALQLLIMLCGADIVERGVRDLLRLRPGHESAVMLSCAVSAAHVLAVCLFDGVIAFLPYCAVNALSVLALMHGHRLKLRAKLITCRAAMKAEKPHTAYMESSLWNNSPGVTKMEGIAPGVVAEMDTPDLVTRFFTLYMPMVLSASFVFALIASVGRGKPGNFLWAWSAILSVSVSLGVATAFSSPYLRLARRLYASRSAVLGWSAASRFANSENITITDADIFPPGSFGIKGLKMLGTHSFEMVTSYAASLISVSGSGLKSAFVELLKEQPDAIRGVERFEHHETGGMSGEIAGDKVMLGSFNFMLRSGLHMPKELNIKYAVFVAINRELAGVFSIQYSPSREIRNAMLLLRRNSFSPLFAVRDFNLTPQMIKNSFKLPDELTEFPFLEDRLVLSDRTKAIYGKPSGIVGEEGLWAYAETVAGGLRLTKTARLNITFAALFSFVGVLIAFYLTYTGSAVVASPCNMIPFQLICALPVALSSVMANKY